MKFEHLAEAKQSYQAHFKDAINFSLTAVRASFYLFVHAIYPDVYRHKGSETLDKLKQQMDKKSKKTP